MSKCRFPTQGTSIRIPVTIKGFDQKVSRDGLKVFITIIKRAAMKDEKCLARGLGFPHFEFELGGDADHVDHDDQ